MIVTPSDNETLAKIKVIGVGGAGNNTVDTIISDYNIDGVEFYAFNTDAQVLKGSLAPVTLQMGAELTRGLGVGGDNMLGAQAAEESIEQIHEYISGADMVFITAGMGGGTGTGAAPVVAGVAKNLGALTVAVVTTPFTFEGKHRKEVALQGLQELKDKVDTLIVVPNQRLLEVVDSNVSFLDAMKEVDKVLAEGVKSIASLVTETGFINVDFADVRAVMTDAGTSLMGIGRASGDNRAEEAARQATNSPLLNMTIEGAKGVLFNIVGGTSLSMSEVDLAANLIQEAVDPAANIIFGATVQEELKDDLVITIVATGFDDEKQRLTLEASTQTQPGNRVAKPASNTTDTEKTQTAPRPLVDSKPKDNNTTESASMQANVQGSAQKTEKPAATTSVKIDDEELEVPAFLRRG